MLRLHLHLWLVVIDRGCIVGDLLLLVVTATLISSLDHELHHPELLILHLSCLYQLLCKLSTLEIIDVDRVRLLLLRGVLYRWRLGNRSLELGRARCVSKLLFRLDHLGISSL